MENNKNKLVDLSLSELKIWFTTNNKSGHKTRRNWLIKNYPELCGKFDKVEGNSFSEKITLFLLGLEEKPKCAECNNEVSYLGSIKRGFSIFCSNLCSKKSHLTSEKKKRYILLKNIKKES